MKKYRTTTALVDFLSFITFMQGIQEYGFRSILGIPNNIPEQIKCIRLGPTIQAMFFKTVL